MPQLRLEIDPLRLDEEWLNQPAQRQIWGEQLADAQFEQDQAKSMLEVVRAETDRDVRDNPEDYGVTKVTETSVANAVIVHPSVRQATKKLNEARHKVNVLQAAVDGLEHRKRALTVLVELQGQDYFATPKMPAGVKNRHREDADRDVD